MTNAYHLISSGDAYNGTYVRLVGCHEPQIVPVVGVVLRNPLLLVLVVAGRVLWSADLLLTFAEWRPHSGHGNASRGRIRRMTSGDARFGEVYERFFRQVHGYCLRRISPDRVDDVVAETFMVTWRRIDDVPEGDSALAWLYAVAYKVLSTQWRGRSRQRKLEAKLMSVGVEPVSSIEDFIITAEASDQGFEALSRLKSTDQEILKLTVWDDSRGSGPNHG